MQLNRTVVAAVDQQTPIFWGQPILEDNSLFPASEGASHQGMDETKELREDTSQTGGEFAGGLKLAVGYQHVGCL